MQRTEKGQYHLTEGMIALMILFFLMILAVLVMTVILLVGAVKLGEFVSDPEALGEVANSLISQDQLSQAFANAMQDPATQKLLQDIFLAGFMAGAAGDTHKKRDIASGTCRGISDDGFCSTVRTSCFKLSRCAQTRNVTVCQEASRDAGRVCDYVRN